MTISWQNCEGSLEVMADSNNWSNKPKEASISSSEVAAANTLEGDNTSKNAVPPISLFVWNVWQSLEKMFFNRLVNTL